MVKRIALELQYEYRRKNKPYAFGVHDRVLRVSSDEQGVALATRLATLVAASSPHWLHVDGMEIAAEAALRYTGAYCYRGKRWARFRTAGWDGQLPRAVAFIKITGDDDTGLTPSVGIVFNGVRLKVPKREFTADDLAAVADEAAIMWMVYSLGAQ